MITAREYAYFLPAESILSWSSIAYINEVSWGCGRDQEGTECVLVDSLGETQDIYRFEWSSATSVLQTNELGVVVASGQLFSFNSMGTAIAKCAVSTAQLQCTVKIFSDTNYVAGSFSPSVDKLIYIGTNNVHAAISILNRAMTALGSYHYTASAMKSITLTHVQSPPNFVGSFVAGTCTTVLDGVIEFLRKTAAARF